MGVPKPVPRSILIARARRGKGPTPQAAAAHANTVMIPYYNDPTMTWRERRELAGGLLSRRDILDMVRSSV